MRQIAFVAAATATLFLVAACGGGGGGGAKTPTDQPIQPPPTEQPVDTDGDGVADAQDAFPNDASETMDSDGDGVGDNVDAFPNDASRAAEVDRLPFPFAYVDDPSTETLFARHYSTRSLPAARSSDAKNMPIFTDEVFTNEAGPPPFGQGGSDLKIFVGADQGDIGALPVTGHRGDSEIRFGQLNDGAGRGNLVAYLRETFTDGKVARWPEAPVVRIQGQASSLEQDMVASTVQLINAALPESYKITLGSPLPEDSGEVANTIRIKFVPVSPRGAGATTYNRLSTSADGYKVVADSYIEFYRNTNSYRDAIGASDAGVVSVRRAVILLAHEMMHALGLDAHPSASHPTILEGTAGIYLVEQNGLRQPLSLLYPIDREALRALYSLEPGSNPLSLGRWAGTSTHIHGNGPHAGFGVALRNSYAEPWAYGYRPDTDLAANRNLSGTVTWMGELLGFSDRAPVAGDAEIGVNLGALDGRADFTSLETWAADTAPGAEGTGTQWLDGDLGYTIAVTGNTFSKTGGDAGVLTGIFTGRNHEGAAGTLERDDLTAAFGADR
ncbi:MAG: thrombospondin type 3 repeat-containing protein [Deltaproteobacteria bacterium]|nr:thrombospondin type 3 repeat-containing protein [Deltaproteobacteria bacterium]